MSATFQNPVFLGGGDPWMYRVSDRCYYFIRSTENNLELYRSETMTGISGAEHRVLWTPPKEGSCCHNIWAPEIHRINGKWYIYFSADDYKGTEPFDYGIGDTTRTPHVIECDSDDPMSGNWVLRGTLGCDPVGIDGTIIQQGKNLYFVYAAYQNFPTRRSDLFIYRMESPCKVTGKPVRICKAEYDWEISTEDPEWKIVEGPAALYKNGKIFLSYAANTVWTDEYCIGLLTADENADLMDPASWSKSPQPIFRQCPESGIYAPGHSSFTTSPDGSETWLVYHMFLAPYDGVHRNRRRDTCLQKVLWDENNMPYFEKPPALGTLIPAPSGEDQA